MPTHRPMVPRPESGDPDQPTVLVPLSDPIEFHHPRPGAGGGVTQPAVHKWIDTHTRVGGSAVVGIEYDGRRLVLVKLRRSGRGQTIQGFLAADLGRPLNVGEICRLFREFSPERGVRVRVAVTTTRGVVRQFPLPQLSARRRWAAAVWKAQKLTPFPLKADHAFFGFRFLPVGPPGSLQVTLVAVPRSDAADVLTAIEEVGWVLQGVSISGAHRIQTTASADPEADAEDATAVALWTPRGGSFAVFRGGRLQFHYDLGPPPDLYSAASPGQPITPRIAAEWLKEMGRSVGDALELYLGAHPQFPPERLELLGIPEAVAPLLTDWQDFFGLPVVVVDVLEEFSQNLPEGIQEWIRTNAGSLTIAVLAAAGQPAVDLTPPALVTARRQRFFGRVARAVFILSVAVVSAWSGLLWMQTKYSAGVSAEASRYLETIQSSSPARERDRAAGSLRYIQSLNAEVTKPPQLWMPWAKSITATVPAAAGLISFGLVLPDNVKPGTSPPRVRLEGRLEPSQKAYSLVFADWINRIDQFAGTGSARLVSSRITDGKGRRISVFVLEVCPSSATQGAGE